MTDELIKTASPGPVPDDTRAQLDQALARYTPAQQQAIVAFWEEVRWTRATGRVRVSIILRELDYWSRYPTDLVARALEIHTRRYPSRTEAYARGIMRSLARENRSGLRPHNRERMAGMPRYDRHYIDGSGDGVLPI